MYEYRRDLAKYLLQIYAVWGVNAPNTWSLQLFGARWIKPLVVAGKIFRDAMRQPLASGASPPTGRSLLYIRRVSCTNPAYVSENISCGIVMNCPLTRRRIT